MKGDFSRIRFNPAKQYTAVLKQQGRVDLDADANEQCAINARLRDTTNIDVIGEYGGPEDHAGFAITIAGNQISIGPGRYYVHGILVENPVSLNYDDQPYLDDAPTGSDLLDQLLQAGSGATLGFVLEVWQRLATALDDPCLLEPALGQADTTARLQTVWRVTGSVAAPASAPVPATGADSGAIGQLSPCCQALYNPQTAVLRTGKMGAGLAQSGSECGCQPIAAAGYQGLENQLYRVEIHNGGDKNTATFKWSRENGSVVTQITGIGVNSPVVTVANLGPDANLGFQAGQWVELSDDTYQFGDPPNRPGLLFQITFVSQAAMQVTLSAPVYGIDTARNARMRRWDQAGASATTAGIPVSGTQIPLENGIQVDFSGGEFQPGDYWTIPARTASGQIDWPPCGGSSNYYQPPSFMQVYRAPVACVGVRRSTARNIGDNTAAAAPNLFTVSDCRLLFPPLTALNADATTGALHVSAISWTNDDVMTTDTLLEKGLSVTFDQATTCPWSGGNFQVSIEPPYGIGAALVLLEGKLPGITQPTFSAPAGTDSFIRTVFALDPPWGITVTGNQVSWIAPVSSVGNVNYGAYEVLSLLNVMLAWQAPIGYARVRVRLIGGSIYGNGTAGNLYLDGQSLGVPGTRAMDGSQTVGYTVPSGNAARVSDYEGWFYLAPTVFVSNVVIQGLENGQETTVSALRVNVNSNNQITGLQIGESASVSSLQASITLSYPPVTATVVSLTFNGTGVGSIISIAASVTVPAGQQTITTPINILANPGADAKDTVTLIASVATAVTTLPSSVQPTLTIAGTTPPAPLIP